MPKYFYFCDRCGRGFASRTGWTEIDSYPESKRKDIARRGPVCSCGCEDRESGGHPMERCGSWPDGLDTMNRRKHEWRRKAVAAHLRRETAAERR